MKPRVQEREILTVRNLGTALVVGGLIATAGCVKGLFPGSKSNPTVSAVGAKANTVATCVGGQDGYGEAVMTGYADHRCG